MKIISTMNQMIKIYTQLICLAFGISIRCKLVVHMSISLLGVQLTQGVDSIGIPQILFSILNICLTFKSIQFWYHIMIKIDRENFWKNLTVENSNLNLKMWPLEFRNFFQGSDLKFIGGDWRELFKFYISGLKTIIKNLVCWWKITKDNRYMINQPKILNLTVFNHMFLNN